MISMFKDIFRSFGYAFRGLFQTICDERNFRIHLVAVCLVSCFAALYGVSVGQAVILVILYAVVLSLELLNTALEHVVNLASPQWSAVAKKAKDAAAGGVLISAIASVVVAVFLFRDSEKWAVVFEKITTPLGIILLIVFVVLSFFFVKGKKRK